MRRQSLIERIKDRIVIDENGCWVWQGATSGKQVKGKAGRGYGKISINGFNCMVHRVSYICEHGYIPNKIQVDHTCRDRLCCNPKHLEAVTHKENCRRRDRC
ncbi:HNH endonuclease signature motif containing protein [Acinetobacter sp.]|uniref:HNH endonuclease signature motif containing protein n=1 Tax=Acinetobacter sp. TaxID=472 RepID=UPI00341DFD11